MKCWPPGVCSFHYLSIWRHEINLLILNGPSGEEYFFLVAIVSRIRHNLRDANTQTYQHTNHKAAWYDMCREYTGSEPKAPDAIVTPCAKYWLSDAHTRRRRKFTNITNETHVKHKQKNSYIFLFVVFSLRVNELACTVKLSKQELNDAFVISSIPVCGKTKLRVWTMRSIYRERTMYPNMDVPSIVGIVNFIRCT